MPQKIARSRTSPRVRAAEMMGPASRRARSILALALAALAVAGCGGGTEEDIAGSEAGSHVTMSMPAPPRGFDPTATVSATDRALFSLLNGTLFRADREGEIQPELAEEYRLADDLRSLRVTLRPGLQFSDGSPLAARDVVATFNRHRGVSGSILASVTSRITEVRELGPLEVEFRFDGPFPSFPGYIAAAQYGIYPADRIADPAFFELPVGAGPYRLDGRWTSGRLDLTANPRYVGQPPAIERLTLVQIEDGNSALSQLRSGSLDFVGDLPPNLIGPASRTPGIILQSSPIFGFYDLRLSNRRGPFSDRLVRQAAAAAIDREPIIRMIWGDANQAQAGFWPPEAADLSEAVQPAHDPAKARALLNASSCAPPCRVKMIYSDQEFPFSSQLALIVQNQLNAAGFDVRMERVDAATILQRMRTFNFDIVPGAMSATEHTPDQLVNNSLDGNGAIAAEFTGYQSAEMDRWIRQFRETVGDEYREAGDRLAIRFAQDVPFIVLAPYMKISATRLPSDVLMLDGSTISVAGAGE